MCKYFNRVSSFTVGIFNNHIIFTCIYCKLHANKCSPFPTNLFGWIVKQTFTRYLNVFYCVADAEAVMTVMFLALMIQCYKSHPRHQYLYCFISIALIISLLISQSDWFSDNRNNANSPLINEWISRSINHQSYPAQATMKPVCVPSANDTSVFWNQASDNGWSAVLVDINCAQFTSCRHF
jgi:hypothetical protein